MHDIEELVESKNKSYGDSVGKSASIIKLLFPSNITNAVYHRVHFMIRIFDKLSRLSSCTIPTESAIDAWRDIAGYALLAIKQEESFEQKRMVDKEDAERGEEDAFREAANRSIFTHGAVWTERGESEGT